MTGLHVAQDNCARDAICQSGCQNCANYIQADACFKTQSTNVYLFSWGQYLRLFALVPSPHTPAPGNPCLIHNSFNIKLEGDARSG
jgi:hypothetical protein